MWQKEQLKRNTCLLYCGVGGGFFLFGLVFSLAG